MPTVEQVERKILEVERFPVRIVRNGRKARRDLRGLSRYPYSKAMANKRTVSDWKRTRFEPNYPDFEVHVLSSNRRSAQPTFGAVVLRRVRRDYNARSTAR